MESDKDSLSHRIRRIEREPVTWEKGKVWDQISEQIQPAPVRWYNLAAVATALLLLTSYFSINEPIRTVHHPEVLTNYQPEEEKRSHDTVRIVELDAKPKSASVNEDPVKVNVIPPATSHPVSANEIVNDISVQRVIQPVVEPFAQQDHTDKQGILVSDNERIRPVVGVIHSSGSAQPGPNNRRQRKLYRLETEAGSSSPPLSRNTLILARKK